MKTTTEISTSPLMTSDQLLAHWQGHRQLTRRVIDAFPEKDLFHYSIGGMRPFGAMVNELLAIAVPGLKGIANGQWESLNEDIEVDENKPKLLGLWDQTTLDIDHWWAKLDPNGWQNTVLTFGQYEGTVLNSILYFIDNEIHHRGQGYVYLRSLGIEPPYFWEH
ncbi:DinB family protein [Pararhodonellum marinum]|uniref:DinB family protein n=1 Tax=Pararhodonellum marinum TaxID=2755358 RepID=UPI00188F4812|nr:DinB family protein [Pararhodonellum marinum]